MKGQDIFWTLFALVLLDLLLVEGDFTCFRKFRTKRGKEFCKGPVRKKNKFPNPEKCCAKRGKGFANELETIGKNRYRCTPCSALLTPRPPILRTTSERPDWGNWSPCSTTCGAGWRSRYRMCDDCDKNHFENVQSQPCMVNFYCPVDGSWGHWLAWTPCSASCGGGTRRRERRCNYPPPTHGGRDCQGEREKEESCNEDPCPVDGNWGPWTRYSQCSSTCGSGTMVRTRQCDDPPQQFGGKDCRGQSVHTRRCKNRECPLHGGWSLWGSWSECSATCDTGVVTRRRSCDSPRPLFGGRDCDGSDKDTRGCFTDKQCPVHGGWSEWSDYGRCNADRCEKGFRMRTRSCNNPRPRNRGRMCSGRSYERSECVNDENCPKEGNWCAWIEWSTCTATCTGLNSMQVRQRSCLCPAPTAGGDTCDGESFEVRECKDVPPCNPYSEVISDRKGFLNTLGEDGNGSGDGSSTNDGDQEDDKDVTTDETTVSPEAVIQN